MGGIRHAQPPGRRSSQARLKELFTEQFLLLKLDPDRAVRAIPSLLPQDGAQRRTALAALRRVVNASGRISQEGTARLVQMETLFSGAEKEPSKGETASV